MTKIYRVEHRTKPLKGFYNHFSCQHWWNLDAPNMAMKKHHVCGTTSLKNFKKWFHDKQLKEIHQSKTYCVYILKADVIYKDENQVVFDRSKAKIIGELLPCGTPLYY